MVNDRLINKLCNMLEGSLKLEVGSSIFGWVDAIFASFVRLCGKL